MLTSFTAADCHCHRRRERFHVISLSAVVSANLENCVNIINNQMIRNIATNVMCMTAEPLYCNRVNGGLWCEHRTYLKKEDYWLGLYKETATAKATTSWYDGNPSTYRNWARGEPNERTTCVRYTKDGFKDRFCTTYRFYYTCKKRAGSLLVQTLISVTVYSN